MCVYVQGWIDCGFVFHENGSKSFDGKKKLKFKWTRNGKSNGRLFYHCHWTELSVLCRLKGSRNTYKSLLILMANSDEIRPPQIPMYLLYSIDVRPLYINMCLSITFDY